MAAPTKRCTGQKRNNEDSTNGRIKRLRGDNKLSQFLTWCSENQFNISSKVDISCDSCAHYGMVATEDIPEGYCLFQVPRSCLLMPENSSIAKDIEKDKSGLSENNTWIPLLITLLYEKNNRSSKWKPYLDLFPDEGALDLPIFWDRSEVIQLLKGTGVDLAVERDTDKIQKDFEARILSFFNNHQHLNLIPSLEFFKKMVGFVMAYSFTEPKEKESTGSSNDSEEDEDVEEEPQMLPPMMVPLADALNHATKNNAKLTFGKNVLKMVATRTITKGEEIFNTYGQVSNLHLMHMYGFAELFPENIHDVVEIPAGCFLDAAHSILDQKDSFALENLESKWNFLKEQDVFGEDDAVILGVDGIIDDDVCIQIIKVLCMTPSEFSDYKEQDGWSDAESDSSLSGMSSLSFETLPLLDARWKDLLWRTVDVHLSNYPCSLKEDEKKLQDLSMSPRQKYALFTAYGQKKLLAKLKEACII